MVGLVITQMPSKRRQIARKPFQQQSAIDPALIRARHACLEDGRGKGKILGTYSEERSNTGKIVRRRPGLAGNIAVELLAIDTDFPANLRNRRPRSAGKAQIFGKSIDIGHGQFPSQFTIA